MVKKSFFLTVIIFVLVYQVSGQVCREGHPEGLGKEGIAGVNFRQYDAPGVPSERLLENNKPGMPLLAGVAVELGIDIMKEARKDITRSGKEINRLGIYLPGAQALGVYFDDFYIPPGGELYVYDAAGKYVLGAFTSDNNTPERQMAISLVPGDRIIIEYDRPLNGSLPNLHIDEVAYHFLPYETGNRDIEIQADFCEVNINCSPEGDEWQDEKRGVARIYVKEGGSFFWCTGSLMNNTRRDRTPYFLTADHCGKYASTQDYQQWIFYFNYESEDCEDSFTSPGIQSMTGASLLSSYDSDGSDFKLLLLRDEVPDNYNPYFNGWSRTGLAIDNGVSVHHPGGDIKKISTFTEELVSASWSGTPNTHWQVRWADTPNGHGVTEGGSSGAPLFDEKGQVIGALTGGLAACEEGGGGPGTGPDKPDYYGKFSWSWSGGNTSSQRLREWLDPDGTGVEELRGINNFLQAEFEASEMILLAGNSVEYTDLSSGVPTYYEWTFEGGEPSSFNGKGPVIVTYPDAGTFDVRLIVADAENTDTLFRPDYIRVVAQLFPNPSSEMINVFIGDEPPDFIAAEIFDLSGRRLFDTKFKGNTSSILSFDISFLPAGMYVVRLAMDDRFHMYKFIVPSTEE